jgi:hypothetical protein
MYFSQVSPSFEYGMASSTWLSPLEAGRFLLLNNISEPSEARQETEIKQKTLSSGINNLVPGFNWYQTSSQDLFVT